MKSVFLIIILSISITCFAEMPSDVNYEGHLAKLVEEGHINQSDVDEKIIQNELTVHNQNKRKRQARGIASTLSKVKVYKIINEPIEIQP